MHRRYWVIALFPVIIALTATVLYAVTRLWKCQLFGQYIRNVNTNDKVIALTFDDGPNPPITNEILSALKEYNARATFFVLGKHVETHMDILREIYRNGNEIGNHSWHHRRLEFRSREYIEQEIQSTDGIIKKSGYAGTIHFRSPFGSGFIITPYVIKKKQKIHVLWNIKLQDWEAPNPESILHGFDKLIKPGSIVLLHDGYPDEHENRINTAKAVELILKKYTPKGYQFVTISELLTWGKPHSGIIC